MSMLKPIEKIKTQMFHLKHELYAQLAYRLPFLPPYRHVFVLTNLCNMKCKNCFQEKDPNSKTLTRERWIALSNEIPAFGRVTITGGEPLVSPYFKDVFKEVAARHDCNLITNGTLLTEELIDLFLSFPKFRILAISIDNLITGKVNIRGYSEKQWNNLEKTIKTFVHKRDLVASRCMLEVKTLILDENADELFDIHRYCAETLKADHHTFQFLKGSPIQHSLKTIGLEEVFKPAVAPVYTKFDRIISELAKIKAYNIENRKTSFLHPIVADIHSPKPLADLGCLNTERFEPRCFKPCKFPWSSVHINYDGEVFPCLAVGLGDLKNNTLHEILRGKAYKNFLKVIRKNGLVQACNRCGWLRSAQ